MRTGTFLFSLVPILQSFRGQGTLRIHYLQGKFLSTESSHIRESATAPSPEFVEDGSWILALR